jgi:hypothetical protein
MDAKGIVGVLRLERQSDTLREFLSGFEQSRSDCNTAKGVYVCGPPGVGKTAFVQAVLVSEGYDVVSYDTTDTRNKGAVDDMTSSSAGNHNVLSMLSGCAKPIAIVMDDVDGMNTGDKGGINNMIKLIRAKRTKRQRSEPSATTPIICIGGRHVDKKITELRHAAACVIEIPPPDADTIRCLVEGRIGSATPSVIGSIVDYARGDLRRMECGCNLYDVAGADVCLATLSQLEQFGRTENTTKLITKRLLHSPVKFGDHDAVMSETDRTSVGLLFHENIVDALREGDENLYIRCLDNFCFGDRIDRATFQKQIWSFNEMSSLVKTMYNQHLFHTLKTDATAYSCEPRFTKVLTKYSTEYNNSVFIAGMCQRTGMDVKDLLGFFADRHSLDKQVVASSLDGYDISRLDVNRVLKLLGLD